MNEAILEIKRVLYSMYDREIATIATISGEVTIRIPNTKVQGIIKDHNGITLSFLCDSPNIDKDDIQDITTNILYEFIYHFMWNRLDTNIIPYISLELISNLFKVMYCRGMSFSIVI